MFMAMMKTFQHAVRASRAAQVDEGRTSGLNAVAMADGGYEEPERDAR